MTLCNFILSDIVCEKGKEASDILSRFDTLSRAFSNRRVFDENAQRISVHGVGGRLTHRNVRVFKRKRIGVDAT